MNDLAHASQTSDAQPLPCSAALIDGPVDVRGAFETERCEVGWVPRRLPVWTRAQYANGAIEDMVVQPSGVRLAFRTAATALELDVLATHGVWQGDPEPQYTAGFDLVVDGRVVAAGRTATQGNLVFFGADDLADLPDNLHPNAAGYRRMGERFARLVFGPEGPFGKAVAARRR